MEGIFITNGTDRQYMEWQKKVVASINRIFLKELGADGRQSEAQNSRGFHAQNPFAE